MAAGVAAAGNASKFFSGNSSHLRTQDWPLLSCCRGFSLYVHTYETNRGS
jgi:hypothetical protein